MITNPLLELPPATLALLVGDLRQRLVRYLSRWHHHEVLLRYLDIWLAEQPHSATLRQNRAQALVELERGDEALAILDALDAERGPTATRRQLRVQAHTSLRPSGRPAFHALLDSSHRRTLSRAGALVASVLGASVAAYSRRHV
jgi:hypothetical protein